MSRHIAPRWEVFSYVDESNNLRKVGIELAGRTFAHIYPVHMNGPGLQIASHRLNFDGGLVASPDDAPRIWVALKGGPLAANGGPMPWMTLLEKRS
jgi:hypothetical protein